jgi:1A family penicillin-binding protein
MKKNARRKLILRNIAIGFISLMLFLGGVTIIWLSTLQVPDLKSFENRRVAKSTKIFDRTGKILLYDLNQDVRRTVIPFSDMGSNVKNATVAIEDAEFYQHSGVRLKSLLRAIVTNLQRGTFSQGGSTITQQIVKNSLLTQEKTITRKLKEWILALKAERELSKDDILGLYLNESPYGGNIYGVEEASLAYFGIHAKDLSIAQAAYIAALPQAPTLYSPYGKNKARLDERKNIVLQKMHDLGFITTEEYEIAKKEVVTFLPQQTHSIKAPHFVFFVRDELVEKYGEEIIQEGGLSITTTLDYDLQQKAEEIVKKNALLNAKTRDAENAGLVALDPKTGQILAMVGSRDYFDKDIDGAYNVTTAKRQPGSAFKPIVYAEAFKQGYTDKTILFDLRTQFGADCGPWSTVSNGTCYSPQNAEGTYHGPVTVRNALAQSLNIPAVKMLYLVTPEKALKMANDLGIKTLANASRYGLSLVLGGGEVRLLDMVSAYGVFANSGVRNPATPILSVTRDDGSVLENFTDQGAQVLPKNVALTLSDILSDNAARTPMFGAHSPMYIPGHEVAVKTGTTNDSKDAWIIGYTPSLVVGSWVGNNDNHPMQRVFSVSLVGPLWNEFMTSVLASRPNESFESPSPDPDFANLKPVLRGSWLGGESFEVDTISGKLATESTPKETREERVITDVHDILYWVKRGDPRGPKPENPYSDPEFRNWETVVQGWWQGHAGNYPQIGSSQKPTEYDTVHTPESRPIVSIIQPALNTTINPSAPLTVQITASGPYPFVRFDTFWNGSYVGGSVPGGNTFSFIPDNSGNVHAINELKVVAYNSIYSSGEAVTTIQVPNAD